ncbi:MAG: ATP-dependent zinc metalloprotease FtsH [Oligoflexia bacterium]|nr:ATP-dependent zinc metalloprotease FtsH [Oligoflexia bacterium]
MKWLMVFLAAWLVLLAYDFSQFQKNNMIEPYSQFVVALNRGDVSSVSVGKETIEGVLKTAPPGRPKQFIVERLDDPDLTKRLLASGVTVSAVHENSFFRDLLSWIVPALVFVLIWLFFTRRFGGISQGGGMLPIGKSRARVYVEKDIVTRFDDVAGVDEAKQELREVVDFLKNPRTFSKLGGRMPKGVLLVGAPGTGKTLLAKAVAGEASVPFFSINGSEFVELFVGLGAARVRDLFQQAKAQAPCIIFIDELDALGKARGLNAIAGSSNDEKEQTLNQLLAELDGFDSAIGVVLIAATNRPEVLDPALLRSGRFDRQVLVDKPDRQGRAKILEVHMKAIKTEPAVSPDFLASLTTGFSGADLANIVNDAALIATRRQAEAVAMQDFNSAIERVVAGVERKSRLLGPHEKRRVAFHEMGHATVALSLGAGEEVHKVSVIPRGIGALGYTLRRPIEDRYLMDRSELEAKLAIALGGRASEVVFFDDISTGAADDLDKATEIARAMITRYGMSAQLGLATYEREGAPFLASGARAFEYSEATAQRIDAEVSRLLDKAMSTALETVKSYRSMIEEGASILLVQETLDAADIKRLWQKSQRRMAA